MVSGKTNTVPEGEETLPAPLSMLIDVAPETFHDNVAGCPEVMVAGEAVKEEITGNEMPESFFHESIAVAV